MEPSVKRKPANGMTEVAEDERRRAQLPFDLDRSLTEIDRSYDLKIKKNVQVEFPSNVNYQYETLDYEFAWTELDSTAENNVQGVLFVFRTDGGDGQTALALG